ncbi:MAG: CPBP family intramembrane metalloprotease [Burkholderiales bacterium]|nr:CPBP family intramembrane metalloprotease [Burkholderiales bacterium]
MLPAADPALSTPGRRRLALRSAGYLLLALPLVLAVYQRLPVPMVPRSSLVMGLVVMLLLLALAYGLLRREGRSIADLGLTPLRRAFVHLGMGLLAGGMLFGAATLLSALALRVEWRPMAAPQAAAIGGALLFHLVTNACEELAWRGYAFDGLLRGLGHWPAQAVVALVAAVFHVLCGWSWQVALVSTTAGSLLFGLVFIRWRSVPAAIGVHAAWNWTRDLVMSPGSAAALFEVRGLEGWGPGQWQTAQAIYVGVTLAACGGLLLALHRRERGEPP